jgi:hypothetical protein
MRMQTNNAPIDYVWALISASIMILVLVLTYVVGKWVMVGSGLTLAAIYFYARVETGVWIDEVKEFPGKHRAYSETDPRNSIVS